MLGVMSSCRGRSAAGAAWIPGAGQSRAGGGVEHQRVAFCAAGGAVSDRGKTGAGSDALGRCARQRGGPLGISSSCLSSSGSSSRAGLNERFSHDRDRRTSCRARAGGVAASQYRHPAPWLLQEWFSWAASAPAARLHCALAMCGPAHQPPAHRHQAALPFWQGWSPKAFLPSLTGVAMGDQSDSASGA